MMKRHHLIIISSLIIILLVIIQISCGGKPPPHTLFGNYNGLYLYSDGQLSDTLLQAIKINFTETNYEIKIDTTSDKLTDFCLCETFGHYILTSTLTLIQDSSFTNIAICDTCKNITYNPTGIFIETAKRDTLQFKQVKEDTVKILKLIKIYQYGSPQEILRIP